MQGDRFAQAVQWYVTEQLFCVVSAGVKINRSTILITLNSHFTLPGNLKFWVSANK